MVKKLTTAFAVIGLAIMVISPAMAALTARERKRIESMQDRAVVLESMLRTLRDDPGLLPRYRNSVEKSIKNAQKMQRLIEKILEEG